MFNKTFLIVFIINFYFVLGIFQSDDFPNCANSQATISQRLGLLRFRALWLEQARGPNTAARTDFRTFRVGKIPLGIAALKKTFGKVPDIFYFIIDSLVKT